MLQRLNRAWCVAATVMALATCWGHSAAAGQAVGGADAAAADPRSPEPARAMAMFNQVAGWVRELRVPDDAAAEAAHAAAVTLRYEGEVVGRGVSVSADPAGGRDVLAAAARGAIAEARERLPVHRDALMEEALKAAAERIAVTVEVGGVGIPVSPSEWAELAEMVAPGVEGVMVRVGARLDAMFPERMLETGIDAGAAGRVLLSRLTGDPTLGLKTPAVLRAEHGVAFYRFKASVVGQTSAGKPPEFFHRGGRIVRMAEMTEAGLRAWADEMAGHLLAMRIRQDEGARFMGRYSPVTGSAEAPELADDALIGLALTSYGRLNTGGQPVGDVVRGVLLQLGQDAAQAVQSDAALAALVIQLRDENAHLEFGPHSTTMRNFALDSLQTLRRAIGNDGAPAEGTPRSVLGLLACGIARQAGDLPKEQREAVVRRAFVETPPGMLPGQMPWLGWAELAVAGEGDVPAAAALREMRAMVWRHQLRGEALPAASADLAGGIVFTAGRQPLPTWHAARPLAFIATMLGDPRLTTAEELPGELARLLSALRFLRQLTAGEAEGHLYRDPIRARGGVRASPFDQRMPPEATAMTLMAVCETIRSLEAIAARRGRGG